MKTKTYKELKAMPEVDAIKYLENIVGGVYKDERPEEFKYVQEILSNALYDGPSDAFKESKLNSEKNRNQMFRANHLRVLQALRDSVD